MKPSLQELASNWMNVPAKQMVNSHTYFEHQKFFILNAYEHQYTAQEIAEFANYSHYSPIIKAYHVAMDWISVDAELRKKYYLNKI